MINPSLNLHEFAPDRKTPLTFRLSRAVGQTAKLQSPIGTAQPRRKSRNPARQRWRGWATLAGLHLWILDFERTDAAGPESRGIQRCDCAPQGTRTLWTL